jgi:mRNA interferase MazF
MNRSEVWLVSLDPTVGAEITKTRPAVIVSDDSIGILPLRVIVPITGWDRRYASLPWFVRLNPPQGNGLQKSSAADTFQVRSVANQRLVRLLGRLSGGDMERIEEGLALVLRIR